jgi:hypothetical protein
MSGSGIGSHLTPGEAKIQLLREGLSTPLFQMAVRLVLSGQTAPATTNWILVQSDAGKLREWRFETLLPYVSAMNARVQGFLSFPRLELTPDWLREVLNGAGAEPTT